MAADAPDDREIARIAGVLSRAGFAPVLIGGMAMVVHGSTRATMDCDYAIEKSESALRNSVRVMIEAGYGVIFGWNAETYEPLPDGVKSDSTVQSWAVADQPESLWFWHSELRSRIDLVFDLPLPIEDLRARASRISIDGQRILLAAPADLRLMKKAALAAQPSRLADELDLLFLERTFNLS